MTDMSAAPELARAGGRQTLIDRHDLVAALDRSAGNQVTIISAPAGSEKTSLLRAWAHRRGRDGRVAFLSVQPGQHDAQLFWLALLGAVRAATGGVEPPPAAPGFNGPAMVDKVLSELTAPDSPSVLIIDDLHELSSTEAAEQPTTLLTNLPRASAPSWPPATTGRSACNSYGSPVNWPRSVSRSCASRRTRPADS